MTQVAAGIPEGVRRAAEAKFTDQELVDLTFVVGACNGYNRLAVSFREPAVPPAATGHDG